MGRLIKLDKALPKHRDAVTFVPRLGKEGVFRYLANGPDSDEIYEFGEEEYYIFRQFDGKTTFPAIQERFLRRFNINLNLDYLKSFAIQLTSFGLLEPDESAIREAPDPGDDITGIKIFDPDPLLHFLSPAFRWCFSPYFLMFTGIVFLLSLGVLFKYGGDLIFEIQFLWEPTFFFFFPLLGIFVIQIACELVKGLACKVYGGHVHEFGVWFVFKIIPFFYCDLTDALWLKDQSNRKKIFSAGVVFHLLLWSVSIIGWNNTYTGSSMNFFFMIFFCVSSLYLFYSLNPFFQRDGYTLLSMWLKAQDLKSRALNICKHWLFKKQLPEPLTKDEIRILKIYGVSFVIFHFVFWFALLGLIGYLLVSFFNGLGAIIFLIILAFRFSSLLPRVLNKAFSGIDKRAKIA